VGWPRFGRCIHIDGSAIVGGSDPYAEHRRMASGPSPLDEFVRAALSHGQDRASIGAVLQRAGWPAEAVSNALDEYADVVFPVPVPRPRASLSAREAFLYLVLFTSLYISVYNFGHLLFQFIDRAFPDVTQQQYGDRFSLEAVRWAVSALIVAFPVFLWTARHISRQLSADPSGRLSPARRWCTYITLFVAVAFLIGDGMSLVYNLLGGELTVRFTLKSVVVAALAGSMLAYYLRDLRPEERGHTQSAV
jgi:hypothetical protein